MAKKRRKKHAAVTEDLPEATRTEGPTDRYIDAAGPIKGMAPASEVLDLITSVRTIFPDFNRATTVGGLPVRRMHTVHGPTHGGKTAFVAGLLKSFADVGYMTGLVDAEHTFGKEFAIELIHDMEQMRNFLAIRPDSYEEAINAVDEFLTEAMVVKAKYPDHKCILVVDTINKLVPQRELKKMMEKGGEEVSKGHQGRYRAAINQAWLDSLTPKIARADCALVIVAQEREGGDSGDWFNDEVTVKGGAALTFDASLLIRVSKAAPIFLTANKEKRQNDQITGFAHRVRIWKSKVGHMDGNYSDCGFHLSNGKLTPPGFDTARDAVSVGVKLGIVKQSGSWYAYKKRRKQGLHNMVKHVGVHPPIMEKLLDDVAARLDKIEGRA